MALSTFVIRERCKGVASNRRISGLLNPDLQVAGILRSMIDQRRSDNKALSELVEEEYEDVVFKTIITRKAATGRLSINGFNDNSELTQAVEPYQDFVKELLERV